jgi:hypothetical protein
MADATVPSFESTPQFPAQLLEPPKSPRFLYVACIQQPVRKWEKPWQHQRAVALFAVSPIHMKMRLRLEGRLASGEQVLQVVEVGAL